MSPYLLAFVVSEFDCLENDGKTFGVCSPPDVIKYAEYSFDIGQKTLAKLDEILDYKYNVHMAKLHMAAVPKILNAFENWGKPIYELFRIFY